MSLKRFFYHNFNITVAWWKDSRGSFHYGFWYKGLFTGLRYQAPATQAEMKANPSFILPGADLEIIFSLNQIITHIDGLKYNVY